MNIEPRQRTILIVGTLIGALLGAGTAWMLSQSNPGEDGKNRRPIQAGEVFRLTSHMAGMLRDVDDIRRRM